jgi:predicted transcriptional regulator
MTDMTKTTLYLPDELLLTFRSLARRTGRSQAELMREALQGYAADQTPLRLRSVGIAKHASIHGDEVEAWLEANYHPDASWRSPGDRAPE